MSFLSLNVTTSAFVKKKRSKMRYLKEFAKPMDLHRFHKVFLDVSSLIVTIPAFVKKKSSKMRHLKICETNRGQIKEQDVPLT